MPNVETCQRCRYCRTMTYGVACMWPHYCKHKYGPNVFWSDGTKPAGYRTPEDRLADIERRLDRLEGRHGR